ncbi:MAG: lytic transglycosylase domain-containing protein [Defluviitaleaceae bacterium]|nr:lytic transglycosylase domain-containing protein [Defluviitaleaceae bacterium]MCL2240774.1 lytic transglycosylase domain-containing protein [Defluviitaleaceae bacterium]
MKKRRRILSFPVLLLLAVVLAVAVGIMGVRIRFPVYHLEYVRAHAGDIDPSWIMAVIMAESSFRPRAQSPQGAQGLMQLMPATAQWLAGLAGLADFAPEDVWRPEVNIALGSFYLNRLLDMFDGDMRLALAAYNAGQGNVRNWLNDPAVSADGRTLDTIPFPETYHYINRVFFNQRVYAVLLRWR